MSAPGYSSEELEAIQDRWRLRFPPDLVNLLQHQRPLIGGPHSFDWLTSDPAVIQDKLDWPFEGFWFDVVHNHTWWPEWGPKPHEQDGQRLRLAEVFAGVPPLIPLFGHRYLPAEPCEPGNPVFSVYQTDVIVYGVNLDDWMWRERSPRKPSRWEHHLEKENPLLVGGGAPERLTIVSAGNQPPETTLRTMSVGCRVAYLAATAG